MAETGTGAAAEGDDGWSWAIVEIFGHRRHAGRIREEEKFGAKMLRIDVPRREAPPPCGEGLGEGSLGGGESAPAIAWTTHVYGGAAIFSLVPTDEATVMRLNRAVEPPALTRLPPQDPAADIDADDDECYDAEEHY